MPGLGPFHDPLKYPYKTEQQELQEKLHPQAKTDFYSEKTT